MKEILLQPQREPSKERVEQILDVTSMFRRADLATLVARVGDPSLRPSILAANLRHMLASGLIQGRLDGKSFVRDVPAKASKAEIPPAPAGPAPAPVVMSATEIAGALDAREAEIRSLVCRAPATRFADLVKAIDMPGLEPQHVEDFLVKLVREGRLSCHIEDDGVVNDAIEATGNDGGASMATTVDTAGHDAPAPVPPPAPPVESPVPLEERVQDILAYLKARVECSLEELKTALALPGDIDDIEAIVFGLVKDGELPGYIDGDRYAA